MRNGDVVRVKSQPAHGPKDLVGSVGYLEGLDAEQAWFYRLNAEGHCTDFGLVPLACLEAEDSPFWRVRYHVWLDTVREYRAIAARLAELAKAPGNEPCTLCKKRPAVVHMVVKKQVVGLCDACHHTPRLFIVLAFAVPFLLLALAYLVEHLCR